MQKSILYFVGLDNKVSECYYRMRKSTGTNTINSWRLSAIAIESWKHYHDSTTMAVTIMMHRYINVSLKLQTKYCKLQNYTSKLVYCQVNVLFNIRLVQGQGKMGC